MVRLHGMLPGLLCLAAIACAQQPGSPRAAVIDQRIHKLRSLDDNTRAAETKKLAAEIRGLPPGDKKLQLAMALSGLATEGDFGRDTLNEVAAALAAAIGDEPKVPAAAFDELARLTHYEHAAVTLNDPRFHEAMRQLDATDEVRRDADFTLRDLTGKSWTLKQLQGHVVLVNFWATWCPPCRKEMPDLETLYERFSGKGLIILAISDEDQAQVRPFISEAKYTFPILLDPAGAAGKRFRIQGIPKSLVYDRNGALVAQSSDMRTIRQFLDMLKQAGLNE